MSRSVTLRGREGNHGSGPVTFWKIKLAIILWKLQFPMNKKQHSGPFTKHIFVGLMCK